MQQGGYRVKVVFFNSKVGLLIFETEEEANHWLNRMIDSKSCKEGRLDNIRSEPVNVSQKVTKGVL